MSIFDKLFNSKKSVFTQTNKPFKQTANKTVKVPKLYNRGKALGVIQSLTGQVSDSINEFFSGSANMVPQSVIVTSDKSVQALPANPKRKYLLIQNVSGDAIVINFGSEAVVSPQQGFIIYDNGHYEPSIAPLDSIEIIGTVSTNQNINVMEGY